MNKNEIYRSIIISNSLKPSKYVSENFDAQNYKRVGVRSRTCSDNYEIFLHFKDEIIDKAFFTGYGCSISKSSTNIICEYLLGKTKDQAISLLNSYRKTVIKEEEPNAKFLGDLIAFENVSNHLNRIPCALMSANALIVALEVKHE